MDQPKTLRTVARVVILDVVDVEVMSHSRSVWAIPFEGAEEQRGLWPVRSELERERFSLPREGLNVDIVLSLDLQ